MFCRGHPNQLLAGGNNEPQPRVGRRNGSPLPTERRGLPPGQIKTLLSNACLALCDQTPVCSSCSTSLVRSTISSILASSTRGGSMGSNITACLIFNARAASGWKILAPSFLSSSSWCASSRSSSPGLPRAQDQGPGWPPAAARRFEELEVLGQKMMLHQGPCLWWCLCHPTSTEAASFCSEVAPGASQWGPPASSKRSSQFTPSTHTRAVRWTAASVDLQNMHVGFNWALGVKHWGQIHSIPPPWASPSSQCQTSSSPWCRAGVGGSRSSQADAGLEKQPGDKMDVEKMDLEKDDKEDTPKSSEPDWEI